LETVINFNEGNATAYLFTYETAWQKHLEQKLGLKPTLVNDSGGKGYQLPKSLIHMPQAKRRVSDERKVALQNTLAKARQNRLASATT
jgi:predicted mannosyl-3-phosphoglycerate phosphatase (HAD superfamily)